MIFSIWERLQYVMIFSEYVMNFIVEKLREENVMILSENVL